jgi:hypothetical protein
MRALAQPVDAGAGERNWSTYGFIVDKSSSARACCRSCSEVGVCAFQCQVVEEGSISRLSDGIQSILRGTFRLRLRVTMRFLSLRMR